MGDNKMSCSSFSVRDDTCDLFKLWESSTWNEQLWCFWPLSKFTSLLGVTKSLSLNFFWEWDEFLCRYSFLQILTFIFLWQDESDEFLCTQDGSKHARFFKARGGGKQFSARLMVTCQHVWQANEKMRLWWSCKASCEKWSKVESFWQHWRRESG